VDTVDIVVGVIGGITVGLLVTALVLVGTVYVVVKRERTAPAEQEQ
jgi:hypothetical protein